VVEKKVAEKCEVEKEVTEKGVCQKRERLQREMSGKGHC